MVVARGLIEPGAIPPMSAWWPRDATQNRIVFPASSNTGVQTVMSGRWVPPLYGALSAKTSPARMAPALRRMIVSTERSIEPRCTGMCGALATSLPSASNTAQEKSSRSLMLTE